MTRKTNHGFNIVNNDKEVEHLVKVGKNSGYKVKVQIVSKEQNRVYVQWIVA